MKEFFQTLLSFDRNKDTALCGLFGYKKTINDSIYTISKNILDMKFPNDKESHIQYRTADGNGIQVSNMSSYIIQDNNFLAPQMYYLQYTEGNPTIYQYDFKTRKLKVVKNENVNFDGYQLLRTHYRTKANSRSDKLQKLQVLQEHGLIYKYKMYHYFPWFLLDDEKVVAYNFINRVGCDNFVGLNNFVKFPLFFFSSYFSYKFTYFDEYKDLRQSFIQKLDPNKIHVSKIPKGLLFTTLFSLYLLGTVKAL